MSISIKREREKSLTSQDFWSKKTNLNNGRSHPYLVQFMAVRPVT
jgi:hypothetical protein